MKKASVFLVAALSLNVVSAQNYFGLEAGSGTPTLARTLVMQVSTTQIEPGKRSRIHGTSPQELRAFLGVRSSAQSWGLSWVTF